MGRLEDLLLLERAGELPPDMQRDLDLLRSAGEMGPRQEGTKKLPVLREQPGILRTPIGIVRHEEMIQPGGIASPENVGIITGGITGARIGLPFGPYGAILGGLVGAGIGAVTGRGGELGSERLFGPPNTPGPFPLEAKKITPGLALSEMGQAATRGMIAEAIGQGTGAAGSKIAQKLLGPYAKGFETSGREFKETAEKFGIGTTVGEQLEKPSIALVETVPKRVPLGIQPVHKFVTKRTQDIQKAGLEMAEKISPGAARDVETVAEGIKQVAGAKTKEMEELAHNVAKQLGKETPSDLLTAGELAKSAKATRLEAAQEAAGRLYNRVRDMAGKAADAIEAPKFADMAKKITTEESELAGKAKLPGVAATTSGIAKKVGEGVEIGGQTVDPAQLPAQFIKQLGLGESKSYTLEGLRRWQSRLGALVGSTENREARRGWARLYGAVTDDIKAWGNELAPEAKVLLDSANEFYRTQVAEKFFNKTVGKMDKLDADVLAKFYIRPQGSIEPLKRVRAAIGPENFNKVAGAYLDDLVTRSKTPEGVFSVDKYLGQLNSHRPEVLKELFNGKTTALDAVTKIFRNNPNDLIDAIATKEGDKLLDYLIKPRGSVETLRTLRQLLPAQKFDQMTSAFLENLFTRKTVNSQGEFSPDLLLTLVNSRTGYTQEQLRVLLGGRYGEFREFVDVLERIKRTGGVGLNPSETAKGLLSYGQLMAAGHLTIATLGDIAQGDLLEPGQLFKRVGEGLIILSPLALGKIMYSPSGIKWLTEGMKLSPGSKAAIDNTARLIGVLTQPYVNPSERKVSGPTPQAQSIAEGVRAALKDKNIPLTEKMQSAMGATQ